MDPQAAHLARLAAGAPRRASLLEHDYLVHLFARAFDDDPVMRWVFREDSRRDDALDSYFDMAIGQQCAPYDAVFVSRDGKAGAAWLPPEGLKALAGADRPSIWRIWRILKMTGFSRFGRARALGEAMGAHHPKDEPHWYLFFLAVMVEARGHGLGSAILQATLAHIDETGQPAYLDNSNPRNTRLYERHGFRVISEFHAAPDAPPLFGMWRDARAA